jgi:hypothetical protein
VVHAEDIEAAVGEAEGERQADAPEADHRDEMLVVHSQSRI